ncbi:MAG: hypothetical protein FJ109_14545 [Deltaproteobacteria bacterium]|nr:hypothetical protein [Deltaproteobacteria bacterium]
MKTRLAFLALFLMLPLSSAMAVECTTDADCPEGSQCVAVPCACACPACDPDSGAECPPCECPDCPEGGECVEIDVGPGPWYGDECEQDADCPMDFTCQEVPLPCATEPVCPPCACAGCDPDSEDCTDPPECECEPCEEPDPLPCEETTAKVCIYEPKECTADTDCAEGFECLEIEECSGVGGCACTGCACPDCPEGEECPPCDCPTDPLPCECEEEEFAEECTVVGAFCAPKQQECTTDDECPEGWECAGFVGGLDCACAACECTTCAEGEECPECNCPPCDCPEAGTELYCLPGGWSEAGYTDYEAQALGTEKGEDDGGTPEDPASPEPDGGAEQTGGTGGSKENAATDDTGTKGCTAGNTSTGGLGLLLLAALAVLTLRRSRRVLSN